MFLEAGSAQLQSAEQGRANAQANTEKQSKRQHAKHQMLLVATQQQAEMITHQRSQILQQTFEHRMVHIQQQLQEYQRACQAHLE